VCPGVDARGRLFQEINLDWGGGCPGVYIIKKQLGRCVLPLLRALDPILRNKRSPCSTTSESRHTAVKTQIRKNKKKQLGPEVILSAPTAVPGIENPRCVSVSFLATLGWFSYSVKMSQELLWFCKLPSQ